MDEPIMHQVAEYAFAVPPDFLAPYPLLCGCKKTTAARPVANAQKALLLYILAGEGHCATGEGTAHYRKDCLIHTRNAAALELVPQTETEYLFLLLENASPLPAALPPGPLYALEPNNPVHHMLERIYRNGCTGRAGSIYDAAADTFRLLMKLCALCAETQKAYSPVVQDAMACMRNEFAFLTGVDDLADRLGVSKCHLIRTFSKETGMTPGAYLQTVRLENAMLLLRGREYSIDAIASLCGFSGANYFCKVFRKAAGESPGAYRGRAPLSDGLESENARRLLEMESHPLL